MLGSRFIVYRSTYQEHAGVRLIINLVVACNFYHVVLYQRLLGSFCTKSVDHLPKENVVAYIQTKNTRQDDPRCSGTSTRHGGPGYSGASTRHGGPRYSGASTRYFGSASLW